MARGWRLTPTLPDWHCQGVYALYDGPELVYVGHSGNVRDRILAHGRRFYFNRVKVAKIPDRRECQRLERKLLFRLRPVKNGTLPTELNPVGFYRGCGR